MADQRDDTTFVAPLYTLTEAARIVRVPAATLHNWARGYVFKDVDGHQRSSPALVTTTRGGRGAVVPFVGLSEAYVLAAFRAAGVPMQRIRPALERLEHEFGMHAALSSEQLKTDGAEVLWQYRDRDDDGDVIDSLVVVRSGQPVFKEVVEQFLQTITYRDGRVALIRLPQYPTPVIVDPRRNFGAPTVESRGIRVADILDRVRAGEPAGDVADDFLLPVRDVEALAAA
ncbi:DUF433 domain-containing protein [Cellulomonas composti]|nr:DUF433 domain-containing protein [Cellulomonas composti]